VLSKYRTALDSGATGTSRSAALRSSPQQRVWCRARPAPWQFPPPCLRHDPATSPFCHSFQVFSIARFGRVPLQQVRNRQGVHVAIDLVFSAHTPAEGVVLGPYAGMNRPAG